MSNTIIVLGRLGKDAEKGNAGNTPLLKFSVGDTVGFGDKKSTNWWNCVLFGKQAEGQLAQYLVKGAQVQVTGEIKSREYDGKTYYDLNVSRIELVGGKQDGGAPKQQPQQQGYGQQPQGYAASKPQQPQASTDDDSDLPF